MLGWLTFGALLWGRWRYGWRGSVALRWIIAGTPLRVSRLPRQQIRARGPARALMDDISLSTLGAALAVLLATSGFFSIAETAMMAVNRYRLKHRAQRGAARRQLALALLAQDRHAARRDPARQHAGRSRRRDADSGDHRSACSARASSRWRSAPSPFPSASSSSPRSRPRSWAQRTPIASRRSSAYILAPMLKVAKPVVWFVNLFVQGLLQVAAHTGRCRCRDDAHAGGAPLARARGPVLPRQAPRDARQPSRPRGGDASTT
mgnify:CR=1 FL=1